MESSPSAVELTSSAMGSSSSSLMESAFMLNSETPAKRKSTTSEEEARSEAEELLVCEACMRPGHLQYRCPYRRYVKEGTLLAPGWIIICNWCRVENCHPGDKAIHRVLSRKYCGECFVLNDHSTIECPRVEQEQKDIIANMVKLRKQTCDRLARERMERKMALEMENPSAPSGAPKCQGVI